MTINMGHFTSKNPNPVLCVAKDGTVLYSNEAAKPLLIEWDAEIGEKLPSNIVDLVQRVIARKSSKKLEVKVGNRVYLISLHHLPEEEYVNIYGFDISDQKELEEKLRESEKKYRNIVETSAEGIWVFNEFSETTYVNEKMSEMLGYNREEMICRFIWDFAYEEDKGTFQVKLENRKQGKDEVYELKLLRKDGLPLWASVSAKGFFDDAGKFKGSVAMFTDITKRMQMEGQIRQRVEELETLMDIAPVAIFIGHDSKCLNITGNKMANELLETKSGENISANISHPWRIFHKDRELTADELPMQKAAFKNINVRDEELDLLLPSGERRGLLGLASPLHDAEGNVRGSVGIFIDMTEREKTEAKLEETLENLEKLIKERTEDLQKAYDSLKESEKGLAEAQKMAHIGNWEWDIATDKAYWSEEMYRIFKRDPQKSAPSLKEYYGYIHPDDLDYYCNATDYTRKVRPSGFDFRCLFRVTVGLLQIQH
jgi:PAS domain S-box-containing protein